MREATTGGTEKRRQIAAWLLGGGGVATGAGVFLPWGSTNGSTVTGLSSPMANFAAGLWVVALLSLGAAVLIRAGADGTWWTKGLTVALTVGGGFLSLLFPAGVSIGSRVLAGVAVDSTAASAPLAFQVGSWVVAGGLTAAFAGAVVLCTRRRLTTTIAMLVPLTLGRQLAVGLH